jgi:hypothetical protein
VPTVASSAKTAEKPNRFNNNNNIGRAIFMIKPLN